MKAWILWNLLPLGLAAQAALASDLIIGGQTVARRDPVGDSTVGIFTPSPDGHSGSLCTGTLIKDDIALTAAHCISRGTKPVLIFDRDLHAPGAVHRVAQRVAVNPRWARQAGRGMDQGDIALVKFSGAPAGYHAVPSITKEESLAPGRKVTLAGYGISDARTHAGAGRLRRTSVRVLDNRPGKTEMILDQSHGHGACHGDSGGPAFVRSGRNVALAGLTNRSYPDGAPDDCAHGVVYTKVPAYRSWIARNEKKLEAKPTASSLRERLVGSRIVSKRRRSAGGARGHSLQRARPQKLQQLAGSHWSRAFQPRVPKKHGH